MEPFYFFCGDELVSPDEPWLPCPVCNVPALSAAVPREGDGRREEVPWECLFIDLGGESGGA
jgi:hypothetical protein